MGVGVDLYGLKLGGLVAGEGVELGEGIDLVAEQRHPPGAVFQMRREQLHRVAAHPEGAALKSLVVAAVLQRHQVGQQLALRDALALLEAERHGRIGFDIADAVDARHRGHHHHVVALQQGAGGGVAHAVDLFVDGGLFFDIGVGARDIGLGLVVVVIGDEILHRVGGEERAELAVELGGQRLVGGEDEGRALGLLDDVRHGKGLARAGDAEQHLVALAGLGSGRQFGDGVGLVALRGEVGNDLEGLAALGFFRARRAVRREHRQVGQVGAQEAEAVAGPGLLARLHQGAAGHGVGAMPQGFGLGAVELFLPGAHASPAVAGRLTPSVA